MDPENISEFLIYRGVVSLTPRKKSEAISKARKKCKSGMSMIYLDDTLSRDILKKSQILIMSGMSRFSCVGSFRGLGPLKP